MLRRAIALLALGGVFLATYLTLYKVGIIGTLSCSVGNCETVQTSRWALFLGLPVAAWGVAFYLLVFVLALLWSESAWADSRALGWAMVGLTGWGVLFSSWLTYLELYVINAICMWCVVSAVLAALLFGLVLAARPWSVSGLPEAEVG